MSITLRTQDMIENMWGMNRFLCVGLDSELSKIPRCMRRTFVDNRVNVVNTMKEFNNAIVDATLHIAGAYKLNSAFYEAEGSAGIEALKGSIEYIHAVAPSVPVILDFKRADIGNTNSGYVRFAFEYLRADAITVNPYLGIEALKPFFDCGEKTIFVLCRTSNTGARDFQDIGEGDKLYYTVARRVKKLDAYGNCGLVVGATYPNELREIRDLVGFMPLLIPGIGAQGGDLKQTISAGKDIRGRGMIINSSRGIIFASNGLDFAEVACKEAETLHSLINVYREGI